MKLVSLVYIFEARFREHVDFSVYSHLYHNYDGSLNNCSFEKKFPRRCCMASGYALDIFKIFEKGSTVDEGKILTFRMLAGMTVSQVRSRAVGTVDHASMVGSGHNISRVGGWRSKLVGGSSSGWILEEGGAS